MKNTLDEIRENVKKFFDPKDKKYGKLKGKNYKELVFYEVNIAEYIKNDNEFKSLCKVAPKEEFLLEVYYFIRAAYVEGKIGALTYADENMYHKSSLDEYFYEYFKAKR